MTFSIAPFYMTDENLHHFRRWVKKPSDCVINALELLGVLQATPADLMRIAVGDSGLSAPKIEETFAYVYPTIRWRFFRYTDIHTLENFCIQGLQPSHVIFCGYNKQGFRHVFLIGKTNTGKVVLIDPQANLFCDLENSDCFENIQDAEEYYILQGTMTTQQQQQLEKIQKQLQNQKQTQTQTHTQQKQMQL